MSDRNILPEVIRRLKREYPGAGTVLRFSSPFELLVATMLSAQTTDVQVNKVTDTLFKKYRRPEDYATVRLADLQKDVSTVNFFNNKAKNIRASAGMILSDFGGEVPRTMADLIRLPGVARKTANIVLSTAFGINEGIAVDTHVRRLSQRLGLSQFDDPVKIEQDLMRLTPRKDWARLSHLLILHGRAVCQARRPYHERCVLKDICPSRAI